MVTIIILALLFTPTTSQAEPLPAVDAKLREAARLYELGEYQETVTRLKRLLNSYQLRDMEPIAQTHKLLGASYFQLHKKRKARAHFNSLLNFYTDANLDPVKYSPKMVRFLEDLKVERTEKQKKPEAAAKIKLPSIVKKQTSKKKRRQVPPAPSADRPLNLAVDYPRRSSMDLMQRFIPFGYGQFKNGEKRKSLLFLGMEAATLIASFTALALFESQKQEDGSFLHPGRAKTYRGVFITSLTLFGITTAVGITDAVKTYNNSKTLERIP